MKNIPVTGQMAVPIDHRDMLVAIDRPLSPLSGAMHWHTHYELAMVTCRGGERYVGDSHESVDELDIVLIGPRMPHAWVAPKVEGSRMFTLHFHDATWERHLGGMNVFRPVRMLLERAAYGVSFCDRAKPEIRDRILALPGMRGVEGVQHFISLLDFLAQTPNQKMLAAPGYTLQGAPGTVDRRVELVCRHLEKAYARPLKLSDAAAVAGMSESAFCHLFKRNMGENFVDYLNGIRVHEAMKMLHITDAAVAEVCLACGFNNTSNFIRVFRRKCGYSPSEYRLKSRRAITRL